MWHWRLEYENSALHYRKKKQFLLYFDQINAAMMSIRKKNLHYSKDLTIVVYIFWNLKEYTLENSLFVHYLCSESVSSTRIQLHKVKWKEDMTHCKRQYPAYILPVFPKTI